MIIEYEPIGIIHSPFQSLEDMPKQPKEAAGTTGSVELLPKYLDGLKDLEGFSHIILIYHLHRSNGYELQVLPFRDTVRRGLFSTRAPVRPNPIGLSTVRLLGIEENVIHIENPDILDNTPLLDIKPHVPEFDSVEKVNVGWLENVQRKHGAKIR